MSGLDARKILLKHLNEGLSDKRRLFNNIVDYSKHIEAMEEYAELRIKQANGAATKNSGLHLQRVVFSEAEVCATCGQTFAKHSAVTRLCTDRFAHFKQT